MLELSDLGINGSNGFGTIMMKKIVHAYVSVSIPGDIFTSYYACPVSISVMFGSYLVGNN